jgi:hypothetical protein
MFAPNVYGNELEQMLAGDSRRTLSGTLVSPYQKQKKTYPAPGYGFINEGGLDGRRIQNFEPEEPLKVAGLGDVLKNLVNDAESRKVNIPGYGTGYYDDLGNVYGENARGTWQTTLSDKQFERLMKSREFSAKNTKKENPDDEMTAQPPRLLGVPDAPNTLSSLPAPVRGKIQEKEYLSATKTLDTQEREAQPLEDLAAKARRFQDLNASNDTGGLTSLPIIKQLRGVVDPEFQEMESISASIVPKMREPGSGATSDFDARMFQQATVGVGKRKEANDAIAQALVARAQREKERLAFANRYLMQNKTLRGANEAWGKYINDVPIFDPNSKTPKINANRINWEQYFSGQAPAVSNQRPPLSAFEE